MITEPDTILLTETQKSKHPGCIVCGQENRSGLGIQFQAMPDGSVETSFSAPQWCEGYHCLYHGGVISAILDGAMTNCLFARGITAVTGELNVRFRQEVLLAREISIKAWISRESDPLFILKGEIVQDGISKAISTGKFMKTIK